MRRTLLHDVDLVLHLLHLALLVALVLHDDLNGVVLAVSLMLCLCRIANPRQASLQLAAESAGAASAGNQPDRQHFLSPCNHERTL